jgi:hypothetical protein
MFSKTLQTSPTRFWGLAAKRLGVDQVALFVQFALQKFLYLKAFLFVRFQKYR